MSCDLFCDRMMSLECKQREGSEGAVKSAGRQGNVNCASSPRANGNCRWSQDFLQEITTPRFPNGLCYTFGGEENYLEGSQERLIVTQDNWLIIC